jgi:hypothetical protein
MQATVSALKIDVGCLGVALRVSQRLPLIVVGFTSLALLPLLVFAALDRVRGEGFLASDGFVPLLRLLSYPVFAVGIASVALVAFAGLGFRYCRVRGLGVSLREAERALRAALRRPVRPGPVRVASAVAQALTVGSVVAGIGAVVWWNERRLPGFLALTLATIAVLVLALGLMQLLPSLTLLFYPRRRPAQAESDLILLLRPFKADAQHTRNRGLLQPMTREGTVVELLERHARVVAVSDPGHDVQPVGAERMALAMADWQTRVLALMDQAVAIVIALDASPGLVWELERLLEGPRLQKTVFVVWSGHYDWPAGPWAQLASRLGVAASAASSADSGDAALAAVCTGERIVIATAGASTPHTHALATMLMLRQSMAGRARRGLPG